MSETEWQTRKQRIGRGIDFASVVVLVDQLSANPDDLLCHLAFNPPVFTRHHRADRMKRQQVAFFHYYQPEAQEIPSNVFGKSARDRELQLTLPEALIQLPISHHSDINQFIGKLDDADQPITLQTSARSLSMRRKLTSVACTNESVLLLSF